MSRNITKVRYDKFEFLDCDTTEGKPETKCVLNFHIKVEDIPNFRVVFTDEFINFIDSIGGKFDNSTIPSKISFTVVRSVICSDNDKYDTKLGKHLAQTRCQIEAFNIANKIFIEASDSIYRIYVEPLIDLRVSSEKAIINEVKHYYKLSNKELPETHK